MPDRPFDPATDLCLILVKSGTLILEECFVTIENQTFTPAIDILSCLVLMPHTTAYVTGCHFRGGGPEKHPSSAIFAHHANAVIERSQLHGFVRGAVLAELLPTNFFVFNGNALHACRWGGLYIKGAGSKPVVLKNVFARCRKHASLFIDRRVEAFICQNEFQVNDIAIEICDNSSLVMHNRIQKSNFDGILITSTAPTSATQPKIFQNFVEESTHNGIHVKGEGCQPEIKGNIVRANMKAGIRLAGWANAIVGGPGKADFAAGLASIDNQRAVELYHALFDRFLASEVPIDAGADGTRALVKKLHQVLEATAAFKSGLIGTFGKAGGKPKLQGCNLIAKNNCQGILAEEGSCVHVIANIIQGSGKANVALGGQNSEFSCIKFNLIEKSKKEGIFCVEGGASLKIYENYVLRNEHGIVLVQSGGEIRANSVEESAECGVWVTNESKARITGNRVENNQVYGIKIEDPAEPHLEENVVKGSKF